MGMYDSFYDAHGGDWQTKALGKALDRYDIGDPVPGPPIDYQAKVLGGLRHVPSQWSYVTIRNGRVVSVPSARDHSLPLLDYSSGWTPATKER
jgi:hypothetical protein